MFVCLTSTNYGATLFLLGLFCAATFVLLIIASVLNDKLIEARRELTSVRASLPNLQLSQAALKAPQ